MTTKPDPVVVLLEIIAKHDSHSDFQDMGVAAWFREKVKAALPLARSQAEKAAAYDAAHSELERSNNELGACRRVANELREKAEALEWIIKTCPGFVKNTLNQLDFPIEFRDTLKQMIEKGGKL